MRGSRLLLLAVLLPFRLVAQAPLTARMDRERPGPYVYSGLGGSTVTEGCDGCAPLSGSGLGLLAGFGWALNDHFAAELSVEGTRRVKESIYEKSALLLVGVKWRVTSRVAVRAAAGQGLVHQAFNSGPTVHHLESDGLGWALGASFDRPVSPQMVISPYVALRGVVAGDLKREGSPVSTGHTFRSLDVGVAFRWHLRSLILPPPSLRGPEH